LVTITVERTLELMLTIYQQSSSGGADSPRFRSYVNAAATMPIQGFNPMTSLPVAATIEALLDADAESRLEVVANETAQRLGCNHNDHMHITVATPGMWTDRVTTEVEHTLLAKDPSGVLWWCGQEVSSAALDTEFVAQTVRLIVQRRNGPPRDLGSASAQEGIAGALAGHPGRLDAGAAEVLAVLGGDTTLATMVAFLYGDLCAHHMGFTPLGLVEGTGRAHAIAVARQATNELDGHYRIQASLQQGK
jgi:hypothetical protein